MSINVTLRVCRRSYRGTIPSRCLFDGSAYVVAGCLALLWSRVDRCRIIVTALRWRIFTAGSQRIHEKENRKKVSCDGYGEGLHEIQTLDAAWETLVRVLGRNSMSTHLHW